MEEERREGEQQATRDCREELLNHICMCLMTYDVDMRDIKGAEKMIESLCKMVVCHMTGDYVLQSDFITRTKGENWYHLFAHCVLYCIPFAVMFGFDERLTLILVSHFMIDAAKARYNAIPYAVDQIMHYVVGFIYLAL